MPTAAAQMTLLLTAVLLPLGAGANDGSLLYREHCLKCHGDDGRGNTWRGFLYGAQDLTEARFQQLRDDEELRTAIERGPGGMPSFSDRLDAAAMAALVRHVRSLAGPE